MYDNQLPAWTSQMLQKHGLTASQKTILLLVDHIGNDLSRLQNEVEKLAINLNGRKSITEDDIEKYIGVSKEYNTFELQDAFAKKNYLKAIRINEYFASNPKVAPIQVTLASLYNFFSKAYMVFGVGSNDEKNIVAQIGVNPYFVKDYLQATKNYGQQGIEGILLLIHDYNLKSVGIGTPPISDSELMKELIVKAMSV
jgi:DNA polymerase-3 subunit delta